MIQCVQIKIEGEVYKTGFRYFLKQKAVKLDIAGYISYNQDHTLNIVAQGERDRLSSFIEFCRSGNKWSPVTGLHYDLIPELSLNYFEVVDENESKEFEYLGINRIY
jgi:acylphosphatase